MTDTTPRLTPITDPSPEVQELYVKGGMRDPHGKPLNIFATVARHPALMKRWLVFAGHVLGKSTLTPRDRELLILRAGVRCNSQYEFSQHAIIARRSDITDEEIEATKHAVDAHGWSEHDAALIRAADELHDDSRISDATWATLRAAYTDEQLLDAVFAVGQYHLVSMVLNTCGVELDEGVPAAL
jgi:4-carboxymuconolactone decarboxylase